MNTQAIIGELEAERDRLTRAIETLRGTAGPRGRRRRAGRHLSPEARKRISQAQKKRWAGIKKK